MAVHIAAAEAERAQARYVAEAGFQHLYWQVQEAACSGYADLPATSFGTATYQATVSPTANSPVTIAATGSLSGGASHTFTRSGVRAYQTPMPVTLQPDPGGGKDGWISNIQTAWNFGGQTAIVVDHAKTRGLIAFDLSTLPAGTRILAAQLELYLQTANGSGTVTLYRVTRAWTEGSCVGTGACPADGATWNTTDGTATWTAPGGDYDPAPVAQQAVATTSAWYAWDITALAAAWAAGTAANHGVLLISGGTLAGNFVSSDDANATLRPKLTLTIACECGVDCSAVSGPPACDADYTPDTKVAEYSTGAYGSTGIKGLTYYPEGKSFNGAAVATGGSWISVDSDTDQIYMTDLSGGLQTQAATPYSSPTGVTFVSSGTYADHLALSDASGGGGISLLDATGAIAAFIDTEGLGLGDPVDVAFIDHSESGTYDGMLAVLTADRWLHFVTQNGALVASLDIDVITAQARGIVQIPNRDLFLIADRGLNRVTKIDFAGVVRGSYSLAGFGVNDVHTVAINPQTCEHAIGDPGSDNVLVLGLGGGSCDGTFRDEFNSTFTYGGNDGTLTWGGPWQEWQEDDGPQSGDEQIALDLVGAVTPGTFQLRVRDSDGGGEGVIRELNLGGASSATLSLSYRRVGHDDAGDYAVVEMSTNGAPGPWTEVARFQGPGTDLLYLPFTVDVSAFISPTTAIRLVTSPSMGGSDAVWFDDVEIRCNP